MKSEEGYNKEGEGRANKREANIKEEGHMERKGWVRVREGRGLGHV